MDGRIRPLTQKGLSDRALVTQFLNDKAIDVVISSPYKRAIDTVADFAEKYNFQIELVENFREHRGCSTLVRGTWADREKWQFPYLEQQWKDFTYKLSDGECLAEVQARNISALNGVLSRHTGKNVIIGTHGMALSTIINYYDNTYGFAEFKAMEPIMPWVVKMSFDDNGCVGMTKIDLFNMDRPSGMLDVRISELGTLKAYRFAVIFAKYQGQWLFCRAKNRDTFETAGGHIEPGETPLEAAKRELCEETGAITFDINPLFDYAVHSVNGYSNGQVLFAKIHELGDIPNFEMAEVQLFNKLPNKMTYPHIQPYLFKKVEEMIDAI